MFPAINMVSVEEVVEEVEEEDMTSLDDDMMDTVTYGMMPRQAWLYR